MQELLKNLNLKHNGKLNTFIICKFVKLVRLLNMFAQNLDNDENSCGRNSVPT